MLWADLLQVTWRMWSACGRRWSNKEWSPRCDSASASTCFNLLHCFIEQKKITTSRAISCEASHLWAVLTACAYAQPPLPDTAAQRYQVRISSNLHGLWHGLCLCVSMMCQLIQLCAMIFVLNCVEDLEHILPMAQIVQDWVAAGGSTDRHVVSALRAALEGVKRATPRCHGSWAVPCRWPCRWPYRIVLNGSWKVELLKHFGS